MKPLILTISGYFLIIIFIIFTLVFPVSLDSDAWYDWISWMMLILSLILNILCFFISVFYHTAISTFISFIHHIEYMQNNFLRHKRKEGDFLL